MSDSDESSEDNISLPEFEQVHQWLSCQRFMSLMNADQEYHKQLESSKFYLLKKSKSNKNTSQAKLKKLSKVTTTLDVKEDTTDYKCGEDVALFSKSPKAGAKKINKVPEKVTNSMMMIL